MNIFHLCMSCNSSLGQSFFVYYFSSTNCKMNILIFCIWSFCGRRNWDNKEEKTYGGWWDSDFNFPVVSSDPCETAVGKSVFQLVINNKKLKVLFHCDIFFYSSCCSLILRWCCGKYSLEESLDFSFQISSY